MQDEPEDETVYCNGENFRKVAKVIGTKGEFFVYVWSRGPITLYVGCSTHLYGRIMTHDRLTPARMEPTDTIMYIPCVGESQMRLLEYALIKELSPKLNRWSKTGWCDW